MAINSLTSDGYGSMPDFVLRYGGIKDKLFNSQCIVDTPALIMFICNECPYVKHISKMLSELTSMWIKRGVIVVGINSNDPAVYPEDSEDLMLIESANCGYEFGYLFDEQQIVAKLFGAVCTPEFFLYDKNKDLYYHGQFDSSRPGNGIKISGEDLSSAVEMLLNGDPKPIDVKPCYGCTITWRK